MFCAWCSSLQLRIVCLLFINSEACALKYFGFRTIEYFLIHKEVPFRMFGSLVASYLSGKQQVSS